MERKKHILTIFMLLFGIVSAAATPATEIYTAYISNDMAGWKRVIDRMESQSQRESKAILELVNYQYGYIGYCMGSNDHRTAKIYLEKAEKNIEILEQRKYKMATLHAYRSAFYGFRIQMNKLSAPVLGPKSINHAKTAMQLDAREPLGYIQAGNGEFYMPSAFGGSKTEALKLFNQALKFMEEDPGQVTNNWNYLSLLTMIGLSHQELKQYQEAKAVFEKILKIEPSFLWVKNELYPALLKKIK